MFAPTPTMSLQSDILDACLGLPPLGSQPEDHAAFGPAPPSIEDEVDGSRPAVPKPHVLDAFNTSWAHPQLKFEPKEEVAEDTPVLEPPASRLTIKSEDDGDGATTAEPLPAAAAATLEPMTAAATLELAAAATSTAEPVPAAAATAEPVPSPPTAPADETAGRRAKLQGHARPPLVPPHCPGCKLLGVFKGTHVIIGANGELPKSKVGAKSKRVAIDESDPRYGELTRPEFTPEFFHYHKVVPNMSLRMIAIFHGNSSSTYTHWRQKWTETQKARAAALAAEAGLGAGSQGEERCAAAAPAGSKATKLPAATATVTPPTSPAPTRKQGSKRAAAPLAAAAGAPAAKRAKRAAPAAAEAVEACATSASATTKVATRVASKAATRAGVAPIGGKVSKPTAAPTRARSQAAKKPAAGRGTAAKKKGAPRRGR